MKHLISDAILIFTALAVISCESVQEYSYVETVLEPSVYGSSVFEKKKDPVSIKAKNDTLAYLEAYNKFTISQKVYQDMSETYGSTLISVPKSFALYNSEGVDVSDVFFMTKAESEVRIHNDIFKMENTLQRIQRESDEKKRASLKVDSAAVKQLTPFFNIKKDEFDPKAPVWYTPKSAPKYINRNGIYCYFETEKDIPMNFRIAIQYFADDWLFIKKIQFSIDGNPYEMVPNNPERDHGDGKIWEWVDQQVRSSDVEIIRALANAKSARMKLIGSQYHKIKDITSQQILDIKRAVELYEALGGQL